MIENVLLMMNAPTNNAMSAKIVKNVPNWLMSLPICSWCSVVSVAPEMTSFEAPTTGARRSTSVSDETPSRAVTEIASTSPGLLSTAWAVASSNSTTDDAPGVSSVPNRTIPTMVACPGSPVESTVVRSPTWNLARSAECLSMAISSGPAGGRPELIVNGLSSGTVTQFWPCTPVLTDPTALPCLSRIWAYPTTSMLAWSTPSVRRMVSSRVASSGGPLSP